MAQRTVGSDDETSYQDNWRATRESVEQTLADIYSLIWDNSGRNRQTELILSSDRLPYAVDVLLEVSIILPDIHLHDAHDGTQGIRLITN